MRMNEKQIQQRLQELRVAKSELTSGDTTGLVYVSTSPGAAFIVSPRMDALQKVQDEITELTKPTK